MGFRGTATIVLTIGPILSILGIILILVGIYKWNSEKNNEVKKK